MPNKAEHYAQMADQTAVKLTSSWQEWAAFLTTAARLYKYPYPEQLMIYAQRPDATACAEYDLWNKTMGRYVRRGSQGIALVDDSGAKPRIRYVFDISDTGEREHSRRPWLWKMEQEHLAPVSAMLEQQYGVSDPDFPQQLAGVAEKLTNEYWSEHGQDVLGIVDDSFLEEYDEYNIAVQFRSAAAISITYSLMSRCGLEPERYFEHEDFMSIFDFNTPATVAALGTAVSQINQEVLRQIGVTIRNAEREKLAERSTRNDQHPGLHPERGLSDSQSDAEHPAGEAPGQVREDAQSLPEGAPAHPLQPAPVVGETVSAPAGDRGDSEPATGTDDARTDEIGGGDGETESQRPDEVGGPDEQSESPSRGSDFGGAYQQLTLELFPSEAEQIQSIDEAESQMPSAFFFAQEDIDHMLRVGSNSDQARLSVTAAFQKQKPLEELVSVLRKEYRGGYGVKDGKREFSVWYGEDGIHFANGRAAQFSPTAQIVPWEEAAQRIGVLLEQGKYATNVEVAEAEHYERSQLANYLWELRGDLSDAAKEQGYLDSLKPYPLTNHPVAMERMTTDLADPVFRQTVADELAAFSDALAHDRELMRFHFYNPGEAAHRLAELSLPRREYASDMAEIPRKETFITEDEIDAAIRPGSNVDGSKGRIYSYFTAPHTDKEKTDFLRNEFGIGGRSHAVSHTGWEDHDGKGIRLRKDNCAEVKVSWQKAAARYSDLIRRDRYFTPEEKAQYDQLQKRNEAFQGQSNLYNSIKEAHPADIVLFQVGDFFEMYGEDAKTAAEKLDLHLTTRPIPGAGRVEMCGIPAHALEQYVEHLRENYGVTIAATQGGSTERKVYSLAPISQEPDQTVSEAEPSQPTIRELYDKYKPTVVAAITEDITYRNACGHTDRETAVTAGNAAIRRAILDSGDTELIHLYTSVPTFRNRLHKEAIEETYPKLHDLLRPLSQDDIDDAIRAWNGSPDSKRAVVRYMKDHARERNTAAWLSREYGGEDGKNLLISRACSPEETKLSWPQVQRRIAQLIKEDRFFTEEEQDRLEDIDPIAVREALAERGIENGVVVDEEKHNNSPFIRQVMEDVAAIAEEESTVETVAVFPGEKTNLPYDIEIQTLRTPEPEPPAQDFSSDFADLPAEELDRNPISIQIGGEWKTFPNAKAAEEASYEEYKDNLRRNAKNFRITDDALGVGGAKAKYQANINAIKLLKSLESEGMQASPEQQEVLSRYVGWGAIPDAFDPNKPNWATEYQELKGLLTPAEYDAARASTLNAHYTSPTVIRAIYEAVGNMGFQTSNILEPAMGVGNFFGMLPEKMQNSRLYGVELDSISGRIAQQLYPRANITVAGFETTDRRDFFDLAVGNVPFGQEKVNDRAYNKLGFSLHNYFFAKALDQVRPGGVVAFVTSRYTMDAKSPDVRKYLAQRADLLGAIRLPNTAFKANAGTEVVSDIIFLQKRDRPIDIEPDWVHLGRTEDGYAINSYFIDHPEMVMGRNGSESTAHGMDYTVEPLEEVSLADQLHDAVQHIHGTYQEAELPELGDGETVDTSIPADPDVKNYSYTVVDGQVYFRENSRMVRPDLNATAEARVKDMVALRDCVHRLIDLQMDDYTPDAAIQEQQAELNRLYDDFTAQYGLINDRGNRLAFSDDSSYYLLCALEVLDEDGKLERKADMFTKRTIQPHHAVTSVDTASEALAVSIAEKASVDMDYMSQLSGKTPEEIASELTGVIFKDPAYGNDPLSGWQTADEYLSGNVRKKLRAAQRAAERDPAFTQNVEALKAAQPKDLDASEIEVRLGATWIHPDYIRQFMYETFDTPRYLRGAIDVKYSSFTAEWQITGKSKIAYNNIAAYNTYGTDRANAYRILEDSLNLRDVRIYDTIEDADGKEKRVLNAKETTLAAQKQQAIRDAFKDWIWCDPERRQALVHQYNEEMNATRPREYDGSHIVFSGMNPEITLREHQKNAIAHVMYGGNTLLAHEVGAGKTFEMVAAAMESKRLGLCQKSIFVVPNHLTEQWASEFLRLYPSANILVTTKKDFETHNRKKFCARIATGDYDAVIIGHSQFEKIPISRERQERLLQDQIAEITEGIEEVKSSGGEQFTVKQLERTKKGLQARLSKLQAEERKDDVVTFEQLGVDRMFVDEAHNYKNMFLYTKMRNVAGLSTTDAQKSSDMFAKCRYLDEITGSRGVIFATGTPVSNSMTELYTMQRYLQYERLREMNMVHFDCWASRFGETVTALELAPEGTGYRARTRFAKFFNLPELMNMFKEVADIKTADQLHLPTPAVEYHTVVAKPTEHQKEMVQALSDRAAMVHGGSVDPSVDNMLKITSDGRKLGLDQRIINPMLPDEAGTKVNQCVENIMQIWQDGQAEKLTQLVFCDISTPRAVPAKRAAKAVSGNLDSPEIHALETAIAMSEPEPAFTVYDDIRQKLIARGVPSEQIAFIHEANTEVRKKELFAKVRTGQVRVLMGSTSKMGAGTNVQDRLVALHDLDCPWRPGDLAQRKGRIERQGNQNELVHVFRYVTEGTFDAYLWQTVENKQKFISQIMTSKSPVRACDDVDETALSFAEIKALCAGDPRIKERMDLDVEVSRLKLMKADHQSKQFRLEDNLLKYFPEKIEQNRGFIQGLEADMKTLSAHPHPAEGFVGMEVRGDHLTDKENAGAALLDACKEVKSKDPVQIGSYRGFTMFVNFNAFETQYELTLRGEMSHRTALGADPRGNLTRIENTLAQMPQRLEAAQAQLDNLYQQQEAAKAESGKPFPFDEELRVKTARLVELDMALNMDGRNRPQQAQTAMAKSARPSVLDRLKVPPTHSTSDKAHKKEMEAR